MDKITKLELKGMKWYQIIDNDFIKLLFNGKTKSELNKEELCEAMEVFEEHMDGKHEVSIEFNDIKALVTEEKINKWILNNTMNRSFSKYLEINTSNIKALLQFSVVPRYFDKNGSNISILQKDIIIQQITSIPKKCGHGSKFVLNLMNIAGNYNMGVQIQSAITDDSKQFGSYLVNKYNFIQKPYNNYDFFSPTLSIYINK